MIFISDFGHYVVRLCRASSGEASGEWQAASGKWRVGGCPVIFISDCDHYVFQLRGAFHE